MKYRPLNPFDNEIRILRPLPKIASVNSNSSDDGLPEGQPLLSFSLEHVSLDNYTPEAAEFLQAAGGKTFADKGIRKEKSSSEPHALLDRVSKLRWTWGDFIAVSYTWGRPTPTCTILLNGQQVKVRRNLGKYLQKVSDGFPGVAVGVGFWVDALCINQDDVEERNAQVLRMKDIYQQACLVHGWLGGDDDIIHLGFEFVLTLSKFYELNPQLHESRTVLRYLMGSEATVTNDLWRGFGHLLANPYWERLWIVQELVLGGQAVVFCCEKSIITWSEFDTAISIYCSEVYLVHKRLTRAFAEDRAHESSNWASLMSRISAIFFLHADFTRKGHATTTSVIECARAAKESDARDKVYGFMSLFSPQISKFIVPDYERSIVEVYRDFTIAIIMAEGRLDIIARAQIPISLVESPSWVLALNQPRKAMDLERFMPYNANGGAKCSFQIEENILRISGFVVGVIDGLGCSCDEDESRTTHTIRQAKNTRTPYGSAVSTQQALFRTLLANRRSFVPEGPINQEMLDMLNGEWISEIPLGNLTPSSFPHATTVELRSWKGFCLLRRCNEHLKIGPWTFKELSVLHAKPSPDVENIPVQQNGCFRVSEILTGRRLAVTEAGHLALVLEDAEVGDLVCVLIGCSTPVVLSRIATSRHYRLLGGCYIDGFMEGEGIEKLQQGEFTLQEFSIV